MTAIDLTVTLEQLEGLYDRTELAILFDWLGIERLPELRDIDIAPDNGEGDSEGGCIRLVCNMEGEYGDFTLANGVARLVLSRIQGRLPQWALVHSDGQVDLARAYSPRRQAKVDLMPRFLFEINWADSGPGYSWPEAYHVAYLPGFDCHVVTASQDSPDAHGYTDEAIGHFPVQMPLQEGVHRVIHDWWRGHAGGWDQHCWAYLLAEGIVDGTTAQAWANEIWDSETGEPLAEAG